MPTTPPALCIEPGCSELVTTTRCAEHTNQKRRDADKRRPNGYQRGWTPEWSAFSRNYLRTHQQCECDDCLALPTWRRPPAVDVDHTGGHSRTCPHALMDANVQALSHPCHSRKTARYDGGFGRGTTPRCG